MAGSSNPFDDLLMSRSLVRWLISSPDSIKGSVKSFRKFVASKIHPDTTSASGEALSKLNSAIDDLDRMTDSEALQAAREYVQGGSDNDLFGPKFELQRVSTENDELRRKIQILEMKLDEKAKGESDDQIALEIGFSKIYDSFSQKDGLPKGFFTPPMLRGYFFFGELQRDLEQRELPPAKAYKMKRTFQNYARELILPIAHVRSDGVLEQSKISMSFGRGALLENARKMLADRVDVLLLDPSLVEWEPIGLLIGFGRFHCKFNMKKLEYEDSPTRIPKVPVDLADLARFVSADYFLTAQDVLRKTKDVETDYLVAVQKEDEKYKVNTFMVKTRAFRRPVAP